MADTLAPVAPAPAAAPATLPEEAAGPADQDLLEEELVVEEISIDGMCGVY